MYYIMYFRRFYDACVAFLTYRYVQQYHGHGKDNGWCPSSNIYVNLQYKYFLTEHQTFVLTHAI